MARHFQVVRVRTPEHQKHVNLVVALTSGLPTAVMLEATMRAVFKNPNAQITQHFPTMRLDILENLDTLGRVVGEDGQPYEVQGDPRFPVRAMTTFEFGIRWADRSRSAAAQDAEWDAFVPVEAEDENRAWAIMQVIFGKRLQAMAPTRVVVRSSAAPNDHGAVSLAFHDIVEPQVYDWAANLYEIPAEAKASVNFRTFVAVNAVDLAWDQNAKAFMFAFDPYKGLTGATPVAEAAATAPAAGRAPKTAFTAQEIHEIIAQALNDVPNCPGAVMSFAIDLNSRFTKALA